MSKKNSIPKIKMPEKLTDTINKYPEHDTNSENCWCEPEIIVMENGNKVIVHQEEN